MATLSGEIRDENGDLLANCVVRVYQRDTGALLVSGTSGSGSEEVAGDVDFDSVSLLLHFEGSNNGTTFTDVCGHTMSRIGTNAVTSTDQAKFGSTSMKITSTSGGQGCSTPDASDLRLGSGDFTEELWIYTTSLSTTQQPFRKGASSSSYSGCFVSITTAGAVQLLGTINGTSWGLNQTSSNGVISINTWHHIAVVRNGTTVTAYVDGTSVASGTLSGTISDSSGSYCVGCGINANPLVGYLDNFRLTVGVARYTGSFTPPDADFYDNAYEPATILGVYDLTTSYEDEVQVIALDPDGGTLFNDLILRTTPV